MPIGDYSGGSNKSSKSSNSNDNRENNRTSQYSRYSPAQVKSGKAKVAKDIADKGRNDLNSLKYKPIPAIVPGSTILNLVGQKGLEKNRTWYQQNVVGRDKKYTNTLDGYKGYMSARGTGNIDAYGRVASPRSINNNQQSTYLKSNLLPGGVGGNEIQTTQAKVDKAAELTAEQKLLRNKKRGRSQSILTGSKGVTKTSSDYSLGKKSLLGRV